MATVGGESGSTPNLYLTKGSCVGCHAMGTANKIELLGSTPVPQVLHVDGSGDLAGGNFAYLLGNKGSGASDAKGHNVIDFNNADEALYGPPGGIVQTGHSDGYNVNDGNLTCSGTNGCHGYRYASLPLISGVATLSGAHHNNVDGKCDVATNPANSYRFLTGVKGYENQTDKWQNVSSSSHNEYFGQVTPVQLGCSGSASHCHNIGISPPDNTMSQFCATCHGNFHTLSTSTSDGIGSSFTSPFIRHPTDVALPASGEYASYTSYNIDAPVARTLVPDAASSAVTPGSDVVMCLSCHAAHATDFPDMLKWDYDLMKANDPSSPSNSGCFVCHTTKDD
ncbi:MAG: hypothetical protein KKG53_06675 [Proteobacteria bacterium]|nr:hypothetical protein [Pseudomonadota bacterium]